MENRRGGRKAAVANAVGPYRRIQEPSAHDNAGGRVHAVKKRSRTNAQTGSRRAAAPPKQRQQRPSYAPAVRDERGTAEVRNQEEVQAVEWDGEPRSGAPTNLADLRMNEQQNQCLDGEQEGSSAADAATAATSLAPARQKRPVSNTRGRASTGSSNDAPEVSRRRCPLAPESSVRPLGGRGPQRRWTGRQPRRPAAARGFGASAQVRITEMVVVAGSSWCGDRWRDAPMPPGDPP